MKALLERRDSDVQVWPAYTDVMITVTVILVFYLLAQAVISSQTSAAMVAVKKRQKEIRNVVETELPDSLRPFVDIQEDGSLQRFTFADKVLFDSARADLKPSGEEILGALGRVLKDNDGSFSRIQIEGHTDTDQPRESAQFASNWELSSSRATSVVRFFQDHSGLLPELLTATGYSEYHPIATGDSEEAKARNRRIEVVLVYSVRDVIEARQDSESPRLASRRPGV